MDTKGRIRFTAQKLFAEHGYDAVSVRDIAAAAEVNLSAISYHFGGKEELLREVLRQGLQDFRAVVSDIGDDHKLPLRIKIEKLLETFFDFLQKEDSVSRILFFEMSVGSTRIPDIAQFHFSWVMDKMTSLLRQGVTNGEIRKTDEFLTTLQFISLPVHLTYAKPIVELMRGKTGYSQEFIKQVAHHVTDVVFDGLAKTNSETAELTVDSSPEFSSRE